ncbi:MAG: bifunctional 5,10-methylenetetrahydrofolate dehydrogenase/5,10-methenyltetrahydrofolate cyclohydrolase [Acidaminococcaceae bacterium]|nr:bifunctional 5,10-methylenetetrahydrofolate dehydrogenase/5,10-methenyltetrahydrofolate cyclohydrolase [Acidaminococcaceae bacterium]
METIIMRGKPVADAVKEKIAQKIALAAKRGEIVGLAIILVEGDEASAVYTKRLGKLAESLGAQVRTVIMPANVSQDKVIKIVTQLNTDINIKGILPMMPLPKHLDAQAICALIAPSKDMDCLSPLNAGEFYLGTNPWGPCTPRACMAALQYYDIALKGKKVVVLGRSNVVGKPVALLLLQQHATVTICHSRTVELPAVLREADIIVAAIGVANFVKPAMVKEGVVIVDVGINASVNGLVGDVDAAVAAKASAFTPVPGGIGIISNAMVMETLTKNL